jgi:flagellar FliL protein
MAKIADPAAKGRRARMAATATAKDAVMPPAKDGGRRRLLLLAAPAAVAAVGAGLWFSGALPKLFGHGKPAATVHPADQPVPVKPPTYVELPEIIANLNSGRRTSFVKLRARLELASPQGAAAVTAAMPRLLDMFQTYLREMRPEELRGSTGTWRLREELIARANIAAAPAQIVDVLFTEMLIQ